MECKEWSVEWKKQQQVGNNRRVQREAREGGSMVLKEDHEKVARCRKRVRICFIFTSLLLR